MTISRETDADRKKEIGGKRRVEREREKGVGIYTKRVPRKSVRERYTGSL